MMIHPIKMEGWDRTAWCGPSALAALTGIPIAKAHSRFAFLTNQKIDEVTGVYQKEMLLALSEFGLKARKVDLVSRYPDRICGVTLERYLRERPIEERMYPLLINVQNHFIVAHMDWLIDNGHPRPTPIEKYAKLGRLVHTVWIVTEW